MKNRFNYQQVSLADKTQDTLSYPTFSTLQTLILSVLATLDLQPAAGLTLYYLYHVISKLNV